MAKPTAPKAGKKKVFKKKEKRVVPTGLACIQASFNNTLVSITDPEGKLICWASSGSRSLGSASEGASEVGTVPRSTGLLGSSPPWPGGRTAV